MQSSSIRSARATALASLLLAATSAAAAAQSARPASYTDRVEIVRTQYHVPHIRAADIAAAYYGLAWVQLEDYGPGTALNLLRARGEMARWFGPDSIRGDFVARLGYQHAVENFHRLDAETRAAYEGFAAGVNRYIEMHPDEFPADFAPRFTAYDVAARDVTLGRTAAANRFLARLSRGDSAATPRGRQPGQQPANSPDTDPIEEGSNAWALAPSRTTSRRAILMRNPHLSWSAGYYEAHITVPGVLDFYGDFRIGGPFGVIGGFNRDLGWSTTNNAPDLHEIYELSVDPQRPDHYLFDGTSLPLTRHMITVEWKNGDGISTETRELWRTPIGPVVHRAGGKIYVIKQAGEGDFGAGEQFLRMMRATSLAEWENAMRMRQRMNSSFTYADRAGNILYLWNAAYPSRPHPRGRDTTAIPARGTSDVWTHYLPYDSLPRLLNPPGGYVQNANDPPHLTNLRAPMDPRRWGDDFSEPPNLRLRSQLSIQLIGSDRRHSLEDVVRLKHSYRMLLADRVKPDLIRAVRAANPQGDVARALAVIERWDNTAAHESRGAVLFQYWWQRYSRGMPYDSAFARPWTATAPASTPAGLRDLPRAAEAFAWAVQETAQRHGSFDVPWGEVHRVRLGETDAPVGGCSGAMGCFRVLNFRTDPDGKRSVTGGDGWVFAVEFGRDHPRAYSILAYGNTNREDSPHFADQAELFARGEMKRVHFLQRDVDANAVTRYRPGAGTVAGRNGTGQD